MDTRPPAPRRNAARLRRRPTGVFMALVVAALSRGLVLNAATVALPKVFAEGLAGVTESTLGVGTLASSDGSALYRFSALDHGARPCYSRISPCLMPRVTASVRLEALSLAKMEPTWNFTVCSEMPRRQAMVLLPKPSAIIPRTSTSRGVKA
jgi:hypothetical protein